MYDPTDGCPGCGTIDSTHDVGCEYIARQESGEDDEPYLFYDEPEPVAETAEQGFPQRTTCRYCKRVLERDATGAPWTSAKLAGLSGRDPECHAAPNPDDGPMPGHEPGSAILSAPEDGNAR